MKSLLSLLIIICTLSFKVAAQETRPSQFIIQLNQEVNNQPVILSQNNRSVIVQRNLIRGTIIALNIFPNKEYTLTINGDTDITFTITENGEQITNRNLNIIAAIIQN